MSTVHRVLAVAILSSFLAACSGSGSNSGGGSDSNAKSPASQAVESFVMAGNGGDYSKAESYIASGSRESVKALGVQTMMDMMTHKGTVRSVEIVSETDVGNGEKSVYVRLHFKDESMTDGTYPLIQEGGAWKIVL